MRSSDAASRWRRPESAVQAAVFLYFAGTSFVVPFLPLYVIQLDGSDIPTAAAWSGVILGSTPLVSGLVAPVWGRMSDRFGQKVLLQRSLLGFTVCLGLMAVVESPAQLLVVRACMGLVGGFTVTAQALVSVSAPRAAVTAAIGRTNAARVLGMAIGPLPGGALADTVGIRAACVASVLGGAVALLIVTLLVRAPVPVRAASPGRRHAGVLSRAFLALMGVVTTVRAAEKSFDPVVPLLVAGLPARPFGTGVATAIVSSAGMLAAAMGSALAYRMGRRGTAVRRPALPLTLLVAAGVTVGMFFSGTWWLLFVLRVGAGFALGIALSDSMAQIALSTPAERRGTAMGFVGSGTSFGSAAGQLGAGLLAAIVLPVVFVVDAVMLVASGVTQWLWSPRPFPEESGAQPDESAQSESVPG